MRTGGSDNTGDGLASTPPSLPDARATPAQLASDGGVSRGPDRPSACEDWEPSKGRPGGRGRGAGRATHRQQQPSPGCPGTPRQPPPPPAGVCLCPAVSLNRERPELQHRCYPQDPCRYPAAETTTLAGGFGSSHLFTRPGDPAPSGPPQIGGQFPRFAPILCPDLLDSWPS